MTKTSKKLRVFQDTSISGNSKNSSYGDETLMFDKNGGVYIGNNTSTPTLIADKAEGKYLPISGGTLTGNLTMASQKNIVSDYIIPRSDAVWATIGTSGKKYNAVYAENLYENGTALVNKYQQKAASDYYMPTNIFDANKKIYINYLSDSLFAADKRYNVTIIGNNGDDLSSEAYKLFDGSYETYVTLKANATYVITIDDTVTRQMTGYCQGNFFLSFYSNQTNVESISSRVYTDGSYWGSQWRDCTEGTVESGSFGANKLRYKLKLPVTTEARKLEFTIKTTSTGTAGLTTIEHLIIRPNITQLPFVSKYTNNTLYHNLTAPNFIGDLVGNAATATTATTATNLSAAPTLNSSGNTITVTAGGKTSTTFTVPYATKAGSATSATNASTANYATNSSTANFAEESTTATTAINANNATKLNNQSASYYDVQWEDYS